MQLFSGPLNSDLRRRQSTDYPSPLATGSAITERPRLSHNSSMAATGSPLRERFGSLKRRDSTGKFFFTLCLLRRLIYLGKIIQA